MKKLRSIRCLMAKTKITELVKTSGQCRSLVRRNNMGKKGPQIFTFGLYYFHHNALLYINVTTQKCKLNCEKHRVVILYWNVQMNYLLIVVASRTWWRHENRQEYPKVILRLLTHLFNRSTNTEALYLPVIIILGPKIPP